jgi:hypothetical protein
MREPNVHVTKKAMFGVPMKLGIANSVLPRNVTVNMTTDEDLGKVIKINP